MKIVSLHLGLLILPTCLECFIFVLYFYVWYFMEKMLVIIDKILSHKNHGFNFGVVCPCLGGDLPMLGHIL